MDNILHGLNTAQRHAVTSPASVVQVLAPPGSGKTKTLTARLAYLIAESELKPWNIITCTFTKKAAKEMKERICNFIGEELSKQIKLGTFHAIAVVYLRQYGQHIGLQKDFGIADSSDSKAILKRIIRKRGFGLEPGPTLGRISRQKTRNVTEKLAQKAKTAEQQEFAQVFAEYEAELETSNLLDYDDLLLRCCELMRTHPQSVSNVEAVLIDEFQDTNDIQYDLMSLLAQKRNVITIVGDPDQSIYGFRNAEIKNLVRMKTQWPDTLTFNLEKNYRSSGLILHAAQNIIEQDQNRPPKKLQATHTPGLRPVLRKLPSATAEAAWLVTEIKRMTALSGNVLKSSDFAILLRSAALSRVIEAALGKEGVPYRMVGGVKFFERAEVKLLLDYLRVINQSNNNEAVERIINVPARRIGDATVKSLHEEARSREVSLWSLVCDIAQGRTRPATKLNAQAEKGLASFTNVILSGQRRAASSDSDQVSVFDLITLVAKKIDLQGYLKNKYENEFEARWSNVEELFTLAADASDPSRLNAMMEEDRLPTIDGLVQRDPTPDDALSLFLANVALTTTAEKKAAEGSEPAQQVTISTIHSAKGLEWPVVFITACYDGSIPHSRSDDTDEERRLLYVGMTRAQAMLYLSCPIKNNQRENTTMSSFLVQPGVASYFENHGPSMDIGSATRLSSTLGREPPSNAAFAASKLSLDRGEDDYWPLDGDEPAEERAKWEYGKAENPLPALSATWPATRAGPTSITASACTAVGFVSVKAKYEELMEQNRLDAIDKRSESRKKPDIDAPKGRKRQIEGQGTISVFFLKRRRASSETEPSSTTAEHSVKPDSRLPNALRDISNTSQANDPRNLPTTSAAHKLRTAPLRRHTSPPSQAPASGYVFLSSSPQKAENEENEQEDEQEDNEKDEVTRPTFTPVTTFHTTSMQSIRPSAATGRRLGVRPSFNGWANRARK